MCETPIEGPPIANLKQQVKMNVISFGDIIFKSNFKRSGSHCKIKHVIGDQGDEDG